MALSRNREVAVSILLPENLSRPWPRRRDFRKTANYLLAVGSEAARGPLRLFCRRQSHGVPPSPPGEWKNVVILGPSHIGDVLYNTASLPALRAGLPHCRLTYVVSGPAAQVLQHNPNLDEVVTIDESGSYGAWLKRARAMVAPYHFDAAIAYAGGISWKDAGLAAFAGIPNRAGYVHKGFSGLITHPVSIRVPQPFPAYFRDLVCQLTSQPPQAVSSLRPLVYPQPEHETAAESAGARLGIDWGRQPVLACAVSSRQPFGIWPRDQFLKTVRLVRERQPCAVVYFGAGSDADDLHRLAAETGPESYVLAGDLDLLSMVAFLRRCTAALTPDSGPRHLANAAGLPVVFLRNLFNRETETGAYCETDHDMVPPGLELIPPAEQATVFAQIDPAEVAQRLIELLRNRFPEPNP